MNTVATVLSPWQAGLRVLLKSEIREQVVSNTTDPTFTAIWTRRPSDFVETETKKLTEDCWEHFPAWLREYEEKHWASPLADTWDKFSSTEKRAVALNFKEYFYKKTGLHKRAQA